MSPAGRLLTRLAPSWAASPLRRLLQTGFFLLFGWLFFVVAWPYGSMNYSQFLRSKEFLDAEWFLAIDPLVSASAALAGRMAVWSLAWGVGMLAVCLVLPRFFCGYACPLGTFIDVFDGAVNRPLRRLFRAPSARGGGTSSCWRHFRYFLLIGILVAGAGGVLLSGWFAPIPIITRGFQFTFSLVELGLRRGWHQVPRLGPEYSLSVALFAGVLLLGLIRPRFWCRYVCPSGAMFSLVNRLALVRRHVIADCTGCGLCRRACSFDAVDIDFATRVGECAFCQTCGGVCPVGAIRFTGKKADASNRLMSAAGGVTSAEIPTRSSREPGTPRAGKVSRRGLLSGVAAGSVAGITGAAGLRWFSPALAEPPVRPPGSVPERDFLRLCVRCGECFRACPNNVLQPMGPAAGLDNLWTPAVVADWSGCEPTCNNCGQVCPTGAIRALSLEDKRVTRIALAVVNERTCLACLGQGDCQTVGRDGHPSLLCRDECEVAGYHAIDLLRVGVETDAAGLPVEGSGYLMPKVAEEKCIGCGLCQTRCNKMNAKQKRLLADSAIRIVAGEGNEDRLLRGSLPGDRIRDSQPGPPTRPAPTGPSDYITDF
jgi:ferredoxin